MKEYIVNGKHYLFKEGEQPEGAVEFKIEAEPQTDAGEPETEAEPQTKAVKPANKARETKKK